MKSVSSAILTSAFVLFAIPVIAGVQQASADEENVVTENSAETPSYGNWANEATCPTGYSERPSYRWSRNAHRWVFDGWICQPNGGYGP